MQMFFESFDVLHEACKYGLTMKTACMRPANMFLFPGSFA